MQGPPMFVDPMSVQPRWICNVRADSDIAMDPGPGFEIGPPASVNVAYSIEQLKEEGLVGLYRRHKDLLTVQDIVDRIASFDDLDLFGDGGK